MAAKPRQSRPRGLSPQFVTGAAEREATADQRYVVDSDSEPPCYVIIDRETNTSERCPWTARSEVYERVAQLNRTGGPTRKENQSWGRLNKSTRQPAVKSKDPTQHTPAEWVEILMNVRETRAVLQDAIGTGRKLSPEDVQELMMFRCVPGIPASGHLGFPLPTAVERRRQAKAAHAQPVSNARHETRQALRELERRAHEQAATNKRALDIAEDAERKLIDAVSRQLFLKLGIERTNWSRRR